MPHYDSIKHHRHSIRLKGYDYAQSGAYFVTICTQNSVYLFGETSNLNEAGQMIQVEWQNLTQRFATIQLDSYVIMPNHFHAIVTIVGTNSVGAGLVPAHLGQIIGAFKSITTWRYTQGVRQHSWLPFDKRLWQRNYYEHIIRNERALKVVREYIAQNPLRWELDRYNAQASGRDPEAVKLWKILREP